eukprot:gnl/TRDRNA2_/TRDRNA2_64043_c0_seq1.p1 gnl/TRDRNA2_/TRDRNA2_64043_c0~~gnl/TRDRNA2_/TRDRNA2_64043_c0_seq1.p1  ORF type:complete len:485 (+),score=91.75 gnl/TRDRNA2_/TRDRNA2_64043_c0_seq1:77-1531(+)
MTTDAAAAAPRKRAASPAVRSTTAGAAASAVDKGTSDQPVKKAVSASGGGPHVRRSILYLMVGVRLMAGLDRMAWAYLIVAMSAEFKWSDQQQGDVKASFAGGYLLLQIIGGIIGDKYGNKMFQTWCLVGLTVGMAVGPFAAAISAEHVGWVYFLMGLLAGPQHPTSTAHQKRWCLPTEKDWLSAVGAIGSIGGSLLAVLGVGSLIAAIGWRMTFWGLSAITLLFSIVYVVKVPELPADCKTMSQDEREMYRKAGLLDTTGQGESSALLGPSVFKLFASPAVWACILAHATYNCIKYTYEVEMPKYFKDVLLMDTAQSSPHLTTLQIVGFVVPLGLKDVLNSLVQTGRCSSLAVRRASALFGYGMIAVASVGMAAVHKSGIGVASPWVVTALLDVIWIGVCAQAFAHMANYLELTANNTGMLMGVGNTIATIPSFLSPKVVAGLMPAWESVFYLVAAMAVVVSLIYSSLCSASVVDEETAKKAQ